MPVDNTLAFDLATMQKKAQEFDGISMVYLCNPNNPTAMLTPSADLSNWVKSAKENVFLLLMKLMLSLFQHLNLSVLLH